MPSLAAKSGLRGFLTSLNGLSYEATLNECDILLRQHRIQGTRDCAVAVVEAFRHILDLRDDLSIGEVIAYVRDVGTQLQSAQPAQQVIENITCRILGLLSEIAETRAETHSMDATAKAKDSTSEAFLNIKEDLLDGLAELRDEIDAAEEQISSYAPEHMHSNDCVLTFGASRQVQRFLLSAAKKAVAKGVNFTVICVENYPQEQEMLYDSVLNGKPRAGSEEENNKVRYKTLTSAGIRVVCVPDSSVMAVMPRVSKVLLPAQFLHHNGGSECPSGAKAMAKAARFHRVPVIVLGAIYCLAARDSSRTQVNLANEDSGRIVRYEDGAFLETVQFVDTSTDILSPNDTTLVVTNIGSYVPSFMHKIAMDHYRKEDSNHG